MQMIGAMGNITGAMLNVGVSIMEGFLEGLRQVGKRIMNWVGNLVSDIVSKIGSALKVWSPSRVMFRLGQQTALGLLKGLESVSPTIIASVGTTAAAIPAAATAGMRAGGAAPASGNGILVDHFSVTVTGVPDTTTARAVGEAVYEGFSAATARRQIQMSVKAI